MKKLHKKMISMSLGLALTLSAGLSVVPTSAFAATASTATASQIISTGEKFMGVPYVFGGHTPSGFDCQGFTKYVFGQYGINLPFGARNQSTVGTYVSRDNIQPGDLLFFSTTTTTKYPADSIKRIGHVGIYMGDGKILHTYGKPGVTITNLNSAWWSSHYVTARRVLSNSGQATPAGKPNPAPSSNSSAALTMNSAVTSELTAIQSFLQKNGYKSYSDAKTWLTQGTTVSKSQLQRGDVLFFSMNADKSIDHVAVYLGSNKVLYKTNTTETTYSLDSSIVQNNFVIAKRAK
jgi:cell wall-associated NlpC family hydrolase